MINKYKFHDTSFLLYYPLGEIPELGEHLELLEENVNLELNKEDHMLPIANFIEFILAGTGKKRTRDRILEEEGISTFYDLQCAYNLMRNKLLSKSARIRKFVEDKYSEIINMKWEELPEKTEEIENISTENLEEEKL